MTSPKDYGSIPTLSQSADIRAIRKALEILTGQTGDGWHRALTPDDFSSIEGIAINKRRLPDGTAGLVVEAGNDTDYGTPPMPTGVYSAATFTTIYIGWDRPTFTSFSYAEVYRSETDTFGDAVRVQTSKNNLIADPVDYAKGYYYWVRFVNIVDKRGPIHDTHGVYAETSPNIKSVMQQLSEEIDESYLAQVLRGRIAIIDTPDTGLIDRLQNEITQRLADILAINNRSDIIDGQIIAVEQDVSQLQIDATTASGNISANLNAINAIDIRLTENEGTTTAQGTDITQIQLDIESLETGSSGSASAISALDARVTTAEGTITSQGSDIAQIELDISDINLGVAGNSDATAALDTRLTLAEGVVTGHSSDLVSLQAQVTSAQGDATAAGSAASALDTRVTAAEGVITSHGAQLTVIDNSISSLQGETTGNAQAITNLENSVTLTNGNVSSLSEFTVSLQNDILDLQDDTSANAAAIVQTSSEVTAVGNTVTAVSSSVTQLQTTVGSNTATLQEHAETVDGMSAMWSVSTNVGTLNAGFGMRIDQTGSEFYINTEKFAVMNNLGNESYPFILVGNDTYISSLFVQDASITSAKIESLSVDKIIGDTAAFIQANIGTAWITSAHLSDFIQSSNYNSTNGWRIESNTGNAYFNAITIRNASGQVVLASGTGIQYSAIYGTPTSLSDVNPADGLKLGSVATGADVTNQNTAAAIAGQGGFATLSQINASNISTYIASAAIGNAFIGNAAVNTLQVAGQAITATETYFSNGELTLTLPITTGLGTEVSGGSRSITVSNSTVGTVVWLTIDIGMRFLPWWSDTDGYPGLSESISTTVSIYRGSTLIAAQPLGLMKRYATPSDFSDKRWKSNNGYLINNQDRSIINWIDSPGNGTFTYSLKFVAKRTHQDYSATAVITVNNIYLRLAKR